MTKRLSNVFLYSESKSLKINTLLYYREDESFSLQRFFKCLFVRFLWGKILWIFYWQKRYISVVRHCLLVTWFVIFYSLDYIFTNGEHLALLHSVSYFFSLYRSPSSSLCTVFDSISSNIDEVLSINPSANVFVFGDFNVL